MDRREMRAGAAAEKARAKALRPWYKKKRFLFPLALVALVIGVAAAGGGDKAGDKATEATQDALVPDTVATERADKQREDQEVAIGQGVQVSGYTGTVTSVGFQPELSVIEKEGYLVAEVTILNRDDRAQPYNTFHWKLQTPNGQVIDPTFSGQQLGSGDLVEGGTVSGKVVWEIGAAKGDFIVIYKPDPFDAARGIWRVTV